MRYPILTTSDSSAYLFGKRAGTSSDLERLVKLRGDGADVNQEFVNELRSDLATIRAKYSEGLKSQKHANQFEAEAARAIHERVVLPAEIIADPDFWLWLSVAHFGDVIEWRYGNPAGGTGLPNYGVGARSENLLYRLWLRAELVREDQSDDPYALCGRGQIDFYRSHLFRQGYANARNFSRALLRFQYPHDDKTTPHLKVAQIRELVKRLRRLRANLFLEILDENACRMIIENEAASVPATA